MPTSQGQDHQAFLILLDPRKQGNQFPLADSESNSTIPIPYLSNIRTISRKATYDLPRKM